MSGKIYRGSVVRLEDDYYISGDNDNEINKGGRRIKVRLDGSVDQKLTDDQLPWCFPLLPKHFQITPKKRENVLVFMLGDETTNEGRFYIGPIVSQDYHLNNAFSVFGTTLLDTGDGETPLPAPIMNPDNEGTMAEKEDIAVQGRDNNGLFFKKNETRLMCGYKVNPVPAFIHSEGTVTQKVGDTVKFNREGLGYIQMKYDESRGSTINLVADQINLLGKKGKEVYETDNQKSLITEAEQIHIDGDAQRMVYGDELVTFLNMFRSMFRKHVHHFYNDRVVDDAEEDQVFWKKNLRELLCEDIRIL